MDEVEILLDTEAGVALGRDIGLLAVGLLVWSVEHAYLSPAPDVTAVQKAVGILDSTINQAVLVVDRGAGVPKGRVVLLLASLFWRDAQICAGPNTVTAKWKVHNACSAHVRQSNTHSRYVLAP